MDENKIREQNLRIESENRVREQSVQNDNADTSQQTFEQKPVSSFPSLRWLVLLFSSIEMMIFYHGMTLPASLYKYLEEIMGSSNFAMKFNLSVTVSALPNTVLPLFAGVLIDRLSARVCLLFWSFMSLIGQILMALGVETTKWSLFFCGRILYTSGFINGFTSNSVLLTKWFSEKELGLTFGIRNTVATCGIVIACIVAPLVAEKAGAMLIFLVGIAMEAVSTCLTCSLYMIDRTRTLHESSNFDHETHLNGSREHSTAENIKEGTEELEGIDPDSKPDQDENLISVGGKRGNLSDILKFKVKFWLLVLSSFITYGIEHSFLNISSALLLERNFFKTSPKGCTLRHPNNCSSGTLAFDDSNPSTDRSGTPCPGKRFSPIIPESLNITTTDSSWEKSEYVFDDLHSSDIDCRDEFWSEACTKNYCNRKHDATVMSGQIMSIPYFVVISLSPVIGRLIDFFECWVQALCLASGFMVVTHTVLAFTEGSPVLPMILHGLGYATVVTIIWAYVKFTVEEQSLGIAYGIIKCFVNAGIAICPLVVTGLYNYSGQTYMPSVEIFYFSFAMAMLVCSMMIILSQRSIKN